MNAAVVQPTAGVPVRQEDSFDLDAVDRWLKDNAAGLSGDPAVRQLTGGASNLTYLIDYPDQRLVLRRPPAGHKAASAHDMAREYKVQAALGPVFPYVPKMVAYCGDTSVIGSEFYVMEYLEGTVLRPRMPEGQLPDAATARAICLNAFDRLVELHAIDPQTAGLQDLGRGDGYVGRQVAGWSDRYRQARTRNVPSFEKVMRWLNQNQPADVASCIIHNDFRLDNLVLDRNEMTRVIGVLDWEMTTIGDPLMDLGGALAYWIEADDSFLMQRMRLQPTNLPGMLTRREIVDHYASRTGLSVDNWIFYEVFGLFRVAAIMQQIYYRYHHKQTRNPKFKHYWLGVAVLDRRCRGLIRKETI